MKAAHDERSVVWRDRMAGALGPHSSSMMLAWLASHRDRLRTLILGGKRLSVLVIWDSGGAEKTDRTEADVAAIEQLVYGMVGPRIADTVGYAACGQRDAGRICRKPEGHDGEHAYF